MFHQTGISGANGEVVLFRRGKKTGSAVKRALLGGAAILAAMSSMTGASSAQSMTTTFAGGNNYAGNMFDITVASSPLVVTALDVNLQYIGSSALISVYTRPGGFTGFTDDPTGWTLMSQNTVTSAGEGNPTAVDISDIGLLAGETYGFYVVVSNFSSGINAMAYTNGVVAYGNADLTFSSGVGKGEPEFTGGTFVGRIWNGTIYYYLGTLPPAGPAWTDEQIAAELTLQAVEQGVMLTGAQSRAIVSQLRNRMRVPVVDTDSTASIVSAFAEEETSGTERVFGYATGNSTAITNGRWTAWADTSADNLRGSWNPKVTGYQARQQFGLDYRFANGWIGGVGIGGSFFSNDFDNGGKLSGDAFWVQPYLGIDVEGWLLSLQAGYTYTRYDTFNTGLGVSDSADGHRLTASATISREFGLANGFYITPEASISAGTEKLSDLTNLTTPATSIENAKFVNVRGGAEIGYRHSDNARIYGLAFAEYTDTSGDGAASYLSTGYEASRLSATLGGGLEFAVGESAVIGLEGRARGIGTDTQIYGASARFSISF